MSQKRKHDPRPVSVALPRVAIDITKEGAEWDEYRVGGRRAHLVLRVRVPARLTWWLTKRYYDWKQKRALAGAVAS